MRLHRPLPPVFANMRDRIEEHEQLMKRAMHTWDTHIICPDCYKPPARCAHLKRRRAD